MTVRISKSHTAVEKIRRCNQISEEHFLPALEGYYGRALDEAERRIVLAHINMLFMEPCPLNLLSAHDDAFSELMLRELTLRTVALRRHDR